MPSPPADPLALRDGDRDRLEDAATTGSPARAQRARILLLAADGLPNADIARRVGVSRPTVLTWRDRYQENGIVAINRAPITGRPRTDPKRIIEITLDEPPLLQDLTWSSRAVAERAGCSHATVVRTWRRWGLTPLPQDCLRFGTNPPVEGQVHAVVGLHITRSNRVVVIALDPEPPATPLQAGSRLGSLPRPKRSLLDALTETNCGPFARDATDATDDFIERVTRACPGRDLRLVADDPATLDSPAVRAWFADNPVGQSPQPAETDRRTAADAHIQRTSAARRPAVLESASCVPASRWVNYLRMWLTLADRRQRTQRSRPSPATITRAVRDAITTIERGGGTMTWVRAAR